MSGYFAVGLHMPKTPQNIGSALRAVEVFGGSALFVAGARVRRSSTDVFNTWAKIPALSVDDLHAIVPYSCVPVAVELTDGAVSLHEYVHPKRALYIFGPEDGTLGRGVTSWCRDVVMIPSSACLNLAAAVNVVLYDRVAKSLKAR